MNATWVVIGLAVVPLSGWMIFGQSDSIEMAKAKCEFAVESFSSFDIGAADVALATVIGDVSNGTVNMPFHDSGKQRLGVCVFSSGNTQSVRLDGQLLAGQ